MRYPFRCSACGLEFEGSCPVRESAANAACPTTPAPPSSGFSHHGHSHGPGAGHHTH